MYAVWIDYLEHYLQAAEHGSSAMKKRKLHGAQALRRCLNQRKRHHAN